MKLLAAIYENIYDLLVEDGSIAIGTIASLVLVGIWSFVTRQNEALHDLGGPLLFVLLMGLLLVNLYKAGRTAAAKRIAD
jgi:hypothetical protein